MQFRKRFARLVLTLFATAAYKLKICRAKAQKEFDNGIFRIYYISDNFFVLIGWRNADFGDRR